MQNVAPVGEIKTVTLTQKRIMENVNLFSVGVKTPLTRSCLVPVPATAKGGMVVELLIPPTFNKLTIT